MFEVMLRFVTLTTKKSCQEMFHWKYLVENENFCLTVSIFGANLYVVSQD